MSRRTRCLCYGEQRRERIALVDEDGNVTGGLTVANYVTACGRVVDAWSPEQLIHNIPPQAWRRPKGVCVRCWSDWRTTGMALDEVQP